MTQIPAKKSLATIEGHDSFHFVGLPGNRSNHTSICCGTGRRVVIPLAAMALIENPFPRIAPELERLRREPSGSARLQMSHEGPCEVSLSRSDRSLQGFQQLWQFGSTQPPPRHPAEKWKQHEDDCETEYIRS